MRYIRRRALPAHAQRYLDKWTRQVEARATGERKDERAGEALFGVARCAGWLAHAIEEYAEPALRFRPRAHYTGVTP